MRSPLEKKKKRNKYMYLQLCVWSVRCDKAILLSLQREIAHDCSNIVDSIASVAAIGCISFKSFMLPLTLSLLRVINVKFPLQPHQKYYITQ